MSVSRLPSGRWRAQVHHPGKHGNVGVGEILGGLSTFRTKAEAKQAREEARRRLRARLASATVRDFAERWCSDELFARPKRSTMIHNAERVSGFVERYGELALGAVSDDVVGAWLAGGSRNATVPALRAMFNDAMSAKAGRLVDRNPFAGLGLARSRGNRDTQPPSEETVWRLIAAARELACPSLAAWLQTAAFTGMRPGELDGLPLASVDYDRGVIEVSQQFSATTREITAPKNGRAREAILTAPAREALLALLVSLSGRLRRFAAAITRPRRAPIIGRRSRPAWATPAACTWRPGTSLAGTWSTSWRSIRRTWRSRSGTQMAVSWCARSMGIETAPGRSTACARRTNNRRLLLGR